MQIVVRDRRYSPSRYEGWKIVYEIDSKTINALTPLTRRAVDHWKDDKSFLGYATMRGLLLKDIESIISATRRGEAVMNVDRWNRVAFYKLK